MKKNFYFTSHFFFIIKIGRQFDKNGNNVNWWEPETDKSFKERTKCIIEQYGNYTVPENGLKVSFYFYFYFDFFLCFTHTHNLYSKNFSGFFRPSTN